MGERDGNKPTPVTNGHQPAGNGAATPRVQPPSVGLPGVGNPKGTPRVAGNRLPAPLRQRRFVVIAPAAQGPNTPRAPDLDDTTLVDGTKVLSPPPPPETFEPPRRRRDPERTQIVTPLPPPELERRPRLGSPTDPLAQTAGEIVCERGRPRRWRMPRAAVVIESARRRGLALGLAVGIAALGGAALGLSAISSSGSPRNAPVPALLEGAARVEEAPPAPRSPVVEELPVAAREPEAEPDEPDEPDEPPIARDETPPIASDETPPPRVERAPVARPLRQRTIAPSSSIGRHKTAQPARASKQARPRALSYDPDALFLKRP